MCGSLNRFIGMIPTGDLEMEDLEYTPERLRRNEQRDVDLGTVRLVGAALAPDGTLAGYHDLYVDKPVAPRPGSASPWCCPSTAVTRSVSA